MDSPSRKSMPVRFATVTPLVALVLAVLPAVGRANPIAVTTHDDAVVNDTVCSLREAIDSANTDAAVGGCSTGSGPDTINLDSGTYKIEIAGADEANAKGDFDVEGDTTIHG